MFDIQKESKNGPFLIYILKSYRYNEVGGSMQRYFSSKKEGEFLFLNDDDFYPISRVMRMQKGDYIEVVFEEKLYVCCYEGNTYARIITEIKEQTKSLPINLILPLLKETKMDLILQKATELGVQCITIYEAERSIIKFDEKKKENKFIRWNRICKEASEQSKRFDIPEIKGIYTIKELFYPSGINLICSTTESRKTIKSLLQLSKKYDRINVIIGPEGGLSVKEEQILIQHGFQKVTLGQRIMRVETVPIYLLSILNYEYME